MGKGGLRLTQARQQEEEPATFSSSVNLANHLPSVCLSRSKHSFYLS